MPVPTPFPLTLSILSVYSRIPFFWESLFVLFLMRFIYFSMCTFRKCIFKCVFFGFLGFVSTAALRSLGEKRRERGYQKKNTWRYSLFFLQRRKYSVYLAFSNPQIIFFPSQDLRTVLEGGDLRLHNRCSLFPLLLEDVPFTRRRPGFLRRPQSHTSFSACKNRPLTSSCAS